MGSPLTDKLKHKLITAGILLLAFGLRLLAIERIPAGLSHDEAYNGITAIQVLQGQWRIFFEINKGIEPLVIYLEALAFYFYGISPVSMRLVNIFSGMLTVALVYPLTAGLFNRRVALLAMAGIAVSFWAIFISRLALRAVLLPPLLLLTLYFFRRALKPIVNYQLPITKSYFFFCILSGVVGGITMYTYLPSRFVPFITLIISSYFLFYRRIARQYWLGLFLHFLFWSILFAPLASYFLENSESFTHRAGQVLTIPRAIEGDPGPLIRNGLRTLGMFTFRGDTTDRYNLDGRPVFDWGNGFLFYLGVGLLLSKLFRSPGMTESVFFLLTSTFFMLLPGLITDDGPHFLRTIGVLPMIYIFWAVGLDVVTQQINRLSNFSKLHFAPIFITSLLSLTTLHTGYDYFYRWANAANARSIYGADIAEVAHYLKTAVNQDLAVISAEYYRDLDPFRFALHFQGRPPFVLWFDGRQTLAFPPSESKLSPRYIFSASAPIAEIWKPLLQYSAEESGRDYNLYRLQTTFPVTLNHNKLKPIGVTVNDDLVLLSYQTLGKLRPGEKFQLVLCWQALRTLPPGTDYTFLVQGYDRQNRLRLEADGNGYDPGSWQPGVLGLQLLTLQLPGDLPPQTYYLSLQLVDRQRGQALPVANRQTTIWLEPVELEPEQ